MYRMKTMEQSCCIQLFLFNRIFSKNEWTCKNPPEICEVMTRPDNCRKTNMRYGCLAFASRHVQYLYTTYNAQAIGIASKSMNRFWTKCLKIHPSPASQMFGFSHVVTWSQVGGAFVALVIEEALILMDQTICRNAQDVVEGRPHLAVLWGRHWLVILVSCQKNKERYRFTK